MNFEMDGDSINQTSEVESTSSFSAERGSLDVVRYLPQREPTGEAAEQMLGGFSLFIDELNQPADRSAGVFLSPGQKTSDANDESSAGPSDDARATTLAYPESGRTPRVPESEGPTTLAYPESGRIPRIPELDVSELRGILRGALRHGQQEIGPLDRSQNEPMSDSVRGGANAGPAVDSNRQPDAHLREAVGVGGAGPAPAANREFDAIPQTDRAPREADSVRGRANAGPAVDSNRQPEGAGGTGPQRPAEEIVLQNMIANPEAARPVLHDMILSPEARLDQQGNDVQRRFFSPWNADNAAGFRQEMDQQRRALSPLEFRGLVERLERQTQGLVSHTLTRDGAVADIHVGQDTTLRANGDLVTRVRQGERVTETIRQPNTDRVVEEVRESGQLTRRAERRPDGTPIEEREFRNGHPSERRRYNEGVLESRESFDLEGRRRADTYYHPNGQPSRQVHYGDRERPARTVHFNDQGRATNQDFYGEDEHVARTVTYRDGGVANLDNATPIRQLEHGPNGWTETQFDDRGRPREIRTERGDHTRLDEQGRILESRTEAGDINSRAERGEYTRMHYGPRPGDGLHHRELYNCRTHETQWFNANNELVRSRNAAGTEFVHRRNANGVVERIEDAPIGRDEWGAWPGIHFESGDPPVRNARGEELNQMARDLLRCYSDRNGNVDAPSHAALMRELGSNPALTEQERLYAYSRVLQHYFDGRVDGINQPNPDARTEFRFANEGLTVPNAIRGGGGAPDGPDIRHILINPSADGAHGALVYPNGRPGLSYLGLRGAEGAAAHEALVMLRGLATGGQIPDRVGSMAQTAVQLNALQQMVRSGRFRDYASGWQAFANQNYPNPAYLRR